MYLLFALAAGLVRRLHINRLYKLSEGVWCEFCEVDISVCHLNKLLKIFYLSFMYFDFFLQILSKLLLFHLRRTLPVSVACGFCYLLLDIASIMHSYITSTS